MRRVLAPVARTSGGCGRDTKKALRPNVGASRAKRGPGAQHTLPGLSLFRLGWDFCPITEHEARVFHRVHRDAFNGAAPQAWIEGEEYRHNAFAGKRRQSKRLCVKMPAKHQWFKVVLLTFWFVRSKMKVKEKRFVKR